MEVLQVIDPKWVIDQVVQECSHLNEQVKKHKTELKNQGNILDMRLSTITSVLRDEIEICNDPKYPENYLEITGNRSSWSVKARNCDSIIRNDNGFLTLSDPSSNDIYQSYYTLSFKRLDYGAKRYKMIKMSMLLDIKTLPPLSENCTMLPNAISSKPACQFVATFRVDEQSKEIVYALYQIVEFGWRYDISNRIREATRWIDPEYIPAAPFDFIDDTEYGEITPESVDLKLFDKDSIEAARAYERIYELKRRDGNEIGMSQAYFKIVDTYKRAYGQTCNHPDLIKAIKRHIFNTISMEYEHGNFEGLISFYKDLLTINEANLPVSHSDLLSLRATIAALQPLVDDEIEESQTRK